ncbi:UNVERIFIED_CONTAM: hypothetical protein FKN15_035237 [Acipenser sinensis]
MSAQSGKVQTVLGLVDPNQLGRTLTHEHLTLTFEFCFCPPPPGQESLADAEIEMQNLFWLKQNPYSSKENLLLNQETVAVKEELLQFKRAGGGTIVENTTTEINRDMKTLKTIFESEKLLEFAKIGSYLEYDLFGTEMLNYPFNPDVDMPSDNERIKRLRLLIGEGFEDRIVIAHDIHTKNRLTKFGGHGYSHILTNIVPRMLQRGITQHAVDNILVENPKRWLTFK